MSHLADSRWFQGDPYRIDPAELDPVDLALSPYLHGTYYDVASQSMMPISSLYPSPTPPPSLQAARRRRQRQRQRSRPMSKRARIPASSKAILGLKEVLPTTTAATTMDDDDDCAICLKALADPADQDKEDQPAAASADVEMMTRLRAMPCSHIFHQHCIFQWLHRNAVCPLCRHQLPTTDDDDDDDGEDEEGYYGTDFWFPAPVTDDEGSWEEEEEPRRRQ